MLLDTQLNNNNTSHFIYFFRLNREKKFWFCSWCEMYLGPKINHCVFMNTQLFNLSVLGTKKTNFSTFLDAFNFPALVRD